MAKKVATGEETPKKAKTKKAAVPDLSALLGEIEQRSYQLYEERVAKGASGNDLGDWLAAEEEIKSKYGIK